MPDEKMEFDLAYHGSDYHNCLWDLDQKLREWIKYDNDFKNVNEALDIVRETLHELMKDHEVEFI
jgi:hypothetical protein